MDSDVAQETKLCRSCATVKPTSEFHRRGTKWQPRCRECQRKVAREWYENRTDEQREAKRERERGWYGRLSPEQLEALREKERQRDRPGLKEYQRQWRQATPGYWEGYVGRRRARLRGAEGFHTREEWWALKAAHGGLCAYCRIRPGTTKDHRIPLSRGGSDWIENIVPACKSCNSRKRDIPVREFLCGL